jgi:hypothetical protein
VTARIAARMLVFTGIAAYMAIGPFYRQVLGGKSKYVRNWVMFSGANTDVCEVRYHLADGTPIDRYEVLGLEPWYTARKSVRKIGSVDEVWRQGRALCSKLGRGTDLRADAKCAKRTGWNWVMHGDLNLCERRADADKAAQPTVPEDD